MHTRQSLPEVCQRDCAAASNSELCDALDSFSPECEGPIPSVSGTVTSEVRFYGEPLAAQDVPKLKSIGVGTLVCRNAGLNHAVTELIALTNENDGRLF